MTKAEVRRVILRHRGALSGVARELGLSKQHVSHVLRGRSDSERVADALRLKAEELKQEAVALAAS